MALHALLLFALVLFTASPARAQDDEQRGQGAVPRGAQGAAVREAEPAPKPTVVEPELVHYEPPVYPSAAKEQGLEAEVKLRLTLDAAGKVTAAEPVEKVGNGFDEAAVQAALKLTFTPAMVNGKAVPVKWGFVYRFELDEPGAAAERAPEIPTTGNIGGRLLVAGSELPLAG
ncbi:MAG TPA: energy transducer TonB, partial [Polyangiaceae bacterium]|nr:energy transducer TonB [Polyangiaceae bacterium]